MLAFWAVKTFARVSGVLLLCLGGASPVLAGAPDANAQGFKAYEKGDIRKAHGLFEKALKKAPGNPYARLNRARTTTLLEHKKDVDDYCDFGGNWVYLALADLSEAVKANRAAILPKIDEDQKGLKALKALDEYKKWRTAVAILAAEKGAVDELIGVGTTSDWTYVLPAQVPVFVTLVGDERVVETRPDTGDSTPAKWVRSGPGVKITPEKAPATAQVWKPQVRESFFNQGKAFFYELLLVPEGTVSEPASVQAEAFGGARILPVIHVEVQRHRRLQPVVGDVVHVEQAAAEGRALRLEGAAAPPPLVADLLPLRPPQVLEVFVLPVDTAPHVDGVGLAVAITQGRVILAGRQVDVGRGLLLGGLGRPGGAGGGGAARGQHGHQEEHREA